MTSWSAPRTWTSETMTSTLLNTHLRDNLSYLFEQIHHGTGTAGWVAWTPTWTNLTVGSGTVTARKAYAGRTTFFIVELTFAANTSISGSVSLSLPDTSITYLAQHTIGDSMLHDNGTALYMGKVYWASTTTMLVNSFSVSGSLLVTANLSSTVPFTWTTNDKIILQGFYERAS